MSYSEVVILIPSHSLEDFPSDLADEAADSLLNSFSVAFHPALIAMTERMPTWYRADEPIDDYLDKLYFLPTSSEEIVPSGWPSRARSEGAVVAGGPFERDADIRHALLRQAFAPIIQTEEPESVLPDDCDVSSKLELNDVALA